MADVTFVDKVQEGAYDPSKWNAQDANQLKSAVNNRVEKVNGKGLSTNDYNDVEKAKVSTALTASENAQTSAEGASAISNTALIVANGAIPSSEKGQGLGVVPLDGSVKIDGNYLPAISTSKKGAVPATGTPSGKFLKDDGTWSVQDLGYTSENVANKKTTLTSPDNTGYPTTKAVADANLLKKTIFPEEYESTMPEDPHRLIPGSKNSLGVFKVDGVTVTVNQLGEITVLLPKFSLEGDVIGVMNGKGEIELKFNFNGELIGWEFLDRRNPDVQMTVGMFMQKLLDLNIAYTPE